MLSRLAICSGHVPTASVVRSFATSSSRAARFGGGGGSSGWGTQVGEVVHLSSRYLALQGIGIRTKAGPTLRERFLGPTRFIAGQRLESKASVF